MLKRAADSLAARVIVFSSLWAILALVVAGGLISTLYERTAERGFRELLVAQLYNLVNSVTADAQGVLMGSPDLGDLRYSQPLSGWYWEVLPASANTSARLSSVSLGQAEIPAPAIQTEPFDLDYRREYQTAGLDGEELLVVETEVVLDALNHVARFRVMGNASILADDIQRFDRALVFYLGLVGFGSVLINALAILLGLRPLRAVRQALAEVRAGRAERLRGRFPAEIRPLAVEMNALIENNRRIVERARIQVGNLAHSLKTPIAVLMNEADAIGGDKGRLVREQSERMRVQVQHYLDRARLAAQAEGAVYRTPVRPVLERLVRVIAKLSPALEVELEIEGDAAEAVFAGEQQDYEEIVGNLIENASKWATSRLRVTAGQSAGGMFSTCVEDDGPGLTEGEMGEAMKRGTRLDEAKPGSGLGLSIVADAVRAYRGSFDLSRSELGGLRVEILLPRALGDEVVDSSW